MKQKSTKRHLLILAVVIVGAVLVFASRHKTDEQPFSFSPEEYSDRREVLSQLEKEINIALESGGISAGIF